MGKKERNKRPDDKRPEARAAQREAYERKQRNQALLWRATIVLAVLGVAAFGYWYYMQAKLLETVTTASYPAGQHVDGKITHKENPPLGGAHNVAWQNCGIYNAPIHSEHAVHSLEHGAVWITYRPDLPADQVEVLRGVSSDDYMLLSPYPGLDAPVVASAWNHQIRLDGANDPRLRAFIAEYKNNPANTPEFGASCFGAVSSTAANDASLTDPAAGMNR